jgi:hypothetical protein
MQQKVKKSKYSDHIVLPNSLGPSRAIFSGPSASGKTNFVVTLLTDPRFMSGFFERLVVFCPSAGQADYLHLREKYPSEEELEIHDFTPALVQEKFEECKEIFNLCEEADAPLPQTLFLFDDLIETPGFEKIVGWLNPKCRHAGVSSWIITQSLMSLSRLCRIQASNIFAFSPTQSEIERLAAECTNALADERTVEGMVRTATAKRYRCFHFTREAPAKAQYRAGLTDIFQLHDPADEYEELR